MMDRDGAWHSRARLTSGQPDEKLFNYRRTPFISAGERRLGSWFNFDLPPGTIGEFRTNSRFAINGRHKQTAHDSSSLDV